MSRTYLEPLVPYDKSLVWSLQDAYFAGRGHELWEKGEIPFQATSVFAAAREHARYVADHVARFRPDDEVVEIVEVGCGNGLFAQNFLRALATSRRPVDRALFQRIRYVVTDWTADKPLGVLARPLVEEFVAAGKLTGAIVDMRHPWLLVELDGFERALAPAVLIANYVVCVLTPKVMHKSLIGAWFERYSRLSVPGEGDPDAQIAALTERAAGSGQSDDVALEDHWIHTTPEAVFGAEVGAGLRDAVAHLREATFTLSPVFLKALREMAKVGALVLVNDFGWPSRDDLEGLRPCQPIRYGLAMSHAVDFAVYDGVAPKLGLEIARTLDRKRSVRVMALAPTLDAAMFRKAYRGTPGDDWLDLLGAGRMYFAQKDAIRAARVFGRCLDVDPYDAELRYRHAQACIDSKLFEEAQASAAFGATLDPALDWAFVLGRLCHAHGRFAEAVVHFRESLRVDDSVSGWANLAMSLEDAGDETGARLAYKTVLARDPSHAIARRAMMLLGEEGEVRVRT